MPEPTQRAQRAISALAAKHSLTVKDSKLANRDVRIHTLYAGGSHLLRLLEGVEIAFAQCASKGEWLAILPAKDLMRLLETESVYNSFHERKAA